MAEVILISPQLVYPQGPVSGRPAEIRSLEKVVNVGMLSVASYLDSLGVEVRILDLVGESLHLEILQKAVLDEKPCIVGFSCISCYGYPVVAEYCRLIRLIDPDVYLLGGGQQLSALPVTAMREIPALDCIVKGEGEWTAWQVIRRVLHGEKPLDVPMTVARNDDRICDNRFVPAPRVNLDDLPFLRYDLLPNFEDYGPEIEISRGCPWKCNFCTSPYMFDNRIRFKSIPRFVAELASICEQYQAPDDLKMFFTCDTFGVRRSQIAELVCALRKVKLPISWRTETRVDSPTVDFVEDLAETGMRVLDLGVESGSPTMLRRMNKTFGSVSTYLEKAEAFIEKIGNCPRVLLKINLVFHAGETPATLAETLQFLLERRRHIDCVSAGPVMLYPGTELGDNYSYYAREFGTSLIRSRFWDQIHAYQVNPSAQLSFDLLNAQAQILAKIMTDEYSYYWVKAHGQLPQTATFEDWRSSLSTGSGHILPFDFDLNTLAMPRDLENPFSALETRPFSANDGHVLSNEPNIVASVVLNGAKSEISAK